MIPGVDPQAAANAAAAAAIAAIGATADTDVIAAITNAANNSAAQYAGLVGPDAIEAGTLAEELDCLQSKPQIEAILLYGKMPSSKFQKRCK